MPDMSDPLGAPKIVTGPEYDDALARLGYNVENMTSSLPLITKIAEAGTSFLDNAYKQQQDYQMAQANLAYKTQQTRQLTDTNDLLAATFDNRVKTSDLNLKQLQMAADFDEQTIKGRIGAQNALSDYNQKRYPIDAQNAELNHEALASDLALRQQQTKDSQAALQRWNDAYPSYPAPFNSDGTINPNYTQDSHAWQDKYRNVLFDPVTSAQAAKMIKNADDMFAGAANTQVRNSLVGQFIDGQKNGRISSVADPTALSNEQLGSMVVRGNLGSLGEQVQNAISSLPTTGTTPQETQQLQQLRGRLGTYKTDIATITHTQNDDELQNIRQSGRLDHYGPNGEAAGDVLADLNRAKTYLEMTGQADKAASIEIQTPKQAGKPQYTFKGTPEQAAQYGFGLEGLKQQAAGIPTITPEEKAKRQNIINGQAALRNPADPAVKEMVNSYLNGQINSGQMFQLYNAHLSAAPETKPPPPAEKGVPANQASSGTVPRIPTSSLDYDYPEGAPDTAGLDRNIYTEIMANEGKTFGPDYDEQGNRHQSVFGIWQDAPGQEAGVYNTTEQYGAESLQAYNAVTNLWAKWAHASGADPWKLTSPGLQMLVMSDVQHKGGAKEVGDALHSLGSYEQINTMDPMEAIRRYSQIRKRFWGEREAPRINAEAGWAAAHDGELRGFTPPPTVAGGARGGYVTPGGIVGYGYGYQYGGPVQDPTTTLDTTQGLQDIATAGLLAGQQATAAGLQSADMTAQTYYRKGGFVERTPVMAPGYQGGGYVAPPQEGAVTPGPSFTVPRVPVAAASRSAPAEPPYFWEDTLLYNPMTLPTTPVPSSQLYPPDRWSQGTLGNPLPGPGGSLDAERMQTNPVIKATPESPDIPGRLKQFRMPIHNPDEMSTPGRQAPGQFPEILQTSARPGSKDTVSAALSPGEYVIRPEIVQKHGLAFFDALNRGELPVIKPQTQLAQQQPSSGRYWGNNA